MSLKADIRQAAIDASKRAVDAVEKRDEAERQHLGAAFLGYWRGIAVAEWAWALRLGKLAGLDLAPLAAGQELS